MQDGEILIVFDNAAGVARCMAPAASIAGNLGARLTGLFPTGYPISAAYGDIAGWMQVAETYRAAQRAEASAAEAAFRETLAARQLTGDWICRESEATGGAVALAALYDLLVIEQPNPDAEARGMAELRPQEVVLGAGRPVLVVPYVGDFAEIGRHAMVAWNGSREAARALHDSMPLLKRADAVTIVEVESEAALDGRLRIGADQVAGSLRRRGIAATAEALDAAGITIDDLLLSRAADLGADLLVMGAYGHSRLREFVLGGVSRSIFRHMTLPVLMSH
jgi:nucleotide-binding universal stress UspA family protein